MIDKEIPAKAQTQVLNENHRHIMAIYEIAKENKLNPIYLIKADSTAHLCAIHHTIAHLTVREFFSFLYDFFFNTTDKKGGGKHAFDK